MSVNDDLGKRMKQYEYSSRFYLTRRLPCIIRVDGKAFHSFTRGFQKPFDEVIVKTMQDTAKFLCENIQGCKLAYTQSDEISLLLTDYDNIQSGAWFDKNLSKIISISASLATLGFNKFFRENELEYCQKKIEEFKELNKDNETLIALRDRDKRLEATTALMQKFWKDNPILTTYKKRTDTALFDSRAFILPKEEVNNYYYWRQVDATRNAIQMTGQANFSHKQLHEKNCKQIQEMLWQEKNINFNDTPTHLKRGSCCIKETYKKDEAVRTRWIIDFEIPRFNTDKDYIEQYI